MSKKIVTNSIYYTLGKILPMAVSFIMVPVYTHYLLPSDYGIVNNMAALQAIFAIFFSLGTELSLFRLFYDYNTDKDKKAFLGSAFSIVLIFSTISVLLLFLLNKSVEKIYSSIEFYPFYSIMIFTTFLGMFQIITKIIFVITEKGKLYFLIGLIQLIISILLNVYYIIILNQKAIGVLKALLVTNIVMLPVYLFYQLRNSRISFNIPIIINIFKYSLPLLPAALSSWILNSSDRIFIDRYFDLTEVGIYSLGYKIAYVFILFITSIRLAYNPVYFRLANSKEQGVSKPKIYQYNHFYFLLSLVFAYLIIFFSKEFIGIFLDEKYFEAWKILVLITFASLILESTSIFRMGIYQSKKTYLVTLIIVGVAALNLLLNWLLIPKFRMYGAAYATIICSFVMIYLHYLFSKRCYFVEVKWKLYLIIILASSLICILFWIIPLSLVLIFYIKLALLLVAIFIIYYLLKDKIAVKIRSFKSE